MQIKIETSTLRTALTAVARAQCTDVTRSHICGVRLQALQDDALDVVATNGYWLARYRARATVAAPGGASAMTIGSACIKPFLVWLKAQRSAHVVIHVDDARVVTDEGGAYVLATEPGDFPAYEYVIPPHDREHKLRGPIGIAAAYMRDVCATFQDTVSKKLDVPLAFRFEGDLDPIVVTSSMKPELLCVVMPVCSPEAKPYEHTTVRA